MTRRMLIDATHDEETRVAVVDGQRLAEFDYESKYRKPLKGSIFLAKVTRVEPSLQAAFVNFGGNRHGFLPFSEIHPDYFRIPIADREALIAEQEAMLAEIAEEEEKEEEAAQQQAEQGGGDAVPEDAEDDLDDEEDDDEEDAVEEVGGNAAELADAEVSSTENPGNAAAAEEQPAQSDAPVQSEDGNAETQEQSGNQDAQPEQQGGDNQQQQQGGRNDHRRNRGGRGGRGRGRHNNKRAQHRSKRVEMVGGEDFDEDRSFRYNMRRNYKIQEVIKRGQIMLIQVSKEERGNKGAAVTSYLSLPGRYCVLMPNSPRAGGVSRKIANYKDRHRMKEMLDELNIPQGMSVIVRTAGVSRSKAEIKRDLDYLMRLWDNIRELTLQSTAPALVYEEADLIKRAVRDLYTRDVEDITVAGEEGFNTARAFMKMMTPSHVKKVQLYKDDKVPLFQRHQIENQISEIGDPTVKLRSGGYLVINPTEALISIDVNSGKATKERHIEETALKTNLEAAEELARQLRLRDLGGLVVVDFIDMEDRRNNAKVERKLKEALSTDRARIQIGRISSFGLLELSRQRMNPSLTEAQFQTCQECKGIGMVRSSDATSIMVLRAIEEEGIKGRAAQLIAHVANNVALYILNHKRAHLAEIEQRYGFKVLIRIDDTQGASGFRVEVARPVDAGAEEDGDKPVQTGKSQNQSQPQNAGNNNAAEDDEGEDFGNRVDTQTDNRPDNRGNREGGNRSGGDRPDGGGSRRGGRRRGRRGGRNRNQRGGGNNNAGQNNNQGNQSQGGPRQDSQPQKETAGSSAPAKKNEEISQQVESSPANDPQPRRQAEQNQAGAQREPVLTATRAESATAKAESGPKKKGWWNKLVE